MFKPGDLAEVVGTWRDLRDEIIWGTSGNENIAGWAKIGSICTIISSNKTQYNDVYVCMGGGAPLLGWISRRAIVKI